MSTQTEHLNPQPAIAAALAVKIARIEWLAADNREDLHPSFVRLLTERGNGAAARNNSIASSARARSGKKYARQPNHALK